MYKKFMVLILVIVMLVCSLPTLSFAAGIDLWTVNAYKMVYRTSTIPQNPQTSISLVSAKNEYESAQIALRSIGSFTINSITSSNLVSGTNTISSSNLSYHYELYSLPDTVKANPFFPENVGKLIYPLSAQPDPLSNDTAISVSANTTQPIFITAYVPATAATGNYTGTISIATTSGNLSVPISVKVSNVTIPTTNQSNFVNYHWVYTNGFTWDGFQWLNESSTLYDIGNLYYNLTPYSEAWWSWLSNFANMMGKYRQNMVWIRTDLLLQQTGIKLSDFLTGVPSNINWTVFDRYVQTFIDAGFTDFANIHLIHSLNKMPASEKPTASWETSLPSSLPTTDMYLSNYIGTLYAHLQSKGWLSGQYQWYQHIQDEPITTDAKNWWRYVAHKIHEIAPLLKTADADPDGILTADNTRQYVDVFVPMTHDYYNKKSLYKSEQSAGKTLWAYTCEVDVAPWLNRFWSQDYLTGRLLFWDLNQEGITGHLHWGWNAWYTGPWNGDSYIVYPDSSNMTLKSSLRLEAHRDGVEDWELFSKLKQTNAILAANIVNSAVDPNDPQNYTYDPAYVKSLHDYLVQAAAGESVGAVPQPSTNIALNKTASADSQETGNEAFKGTDGKTSSRWCAADSYNNHWWKVDLGANYNITGSEVIWEKSNVYKYKIEVSTDNVNWTLKVDKTGNTEGSQLGQDNFTAAARYVRITVTGLTSPYWASFYEFKVFGSIAGGSNIALNKIASADSQQTGNEAAKGNDGSTTTRWCANDGNLNYWWKVDLGASYNITRSEVMWEFAQIYKYKIEVSADNVNWTLKVDKTGNTSSLQTQTDNFAANARYVRITVTGLTPGYWASFYEFRVFN